MAQPTTAAQKRLEERGWTLISEYQGAMKPATCKHTCGFEIEITQFNNFTNRSENRRVKCRTCEPLSERTWTRWTQETYNEAIKDRNIKLLCEWQGNGTNQPHQCLTCSYIWNPKPKAILSNYGCPSCSGNIPWNLERYKSVVDLEEDYKLIELREPKNQNDKLEILHQVCGQSWSPRIGDFINSGSRCPNCIYSRGEKLIIDTLDKYKVENTTQYRFPDCRHKNPLPFDSSIMKDRYLVGLIEYQGQQHYDPVEHWGGQENLEGIQLRDKIKVKYCQDNHIPLLIIGYLETEAMVKALIYSELAQHDLIDETEAWEEYYQQEEGKSYFSALGLPEQ